MGSTRELESEPIEISPIELGAPLLEEPTNARGGAKWRDRHQRDHWVTSISIQSEGRSFNVGKEDLDALHGQVGPSYDLPAMGRSIDS